MISNVLFIFRVLKMGEMKTEVRKKRKKRKKRRTVMMIERVT